MEREKEEKKSGRKKAGYGVDSDTDSDDEEVIAKKGSTSRQIKKGLKEFNLKKRAAASVHINKAKSQIQKIRGRQQLAHIEKFSADQYKSAKGKGDVIKAGKLEPFSYI